MYILFRFLKGNKTYTQTVLQQDFGDLDHLEYTLSGPKPHLLKMAKLFKFKQVAC